MRRVAFAFTVLPSFLLLGQQPATSPTPQHNEAVFSVTSTLVQVDAVVTDSKGHQLTDLKAGDFEVFVDGKPQKIKNFSYVQVTPDLGANAAAEPYRLPRQKLQLPPAPSAPLSREDVRRTIVLMVDDLGLRFTDMAQVRSALHRFVERQMQPRDLVAVCRTGAGSGALQEFTSDKNVLSSIIDHLHWNPNGRGAYSGAYIGTGLSGFSRGAGGAYANRTGGLDRMDFERLREIDSTIGSLESVRFVLPALQEMPGRKSIVFISDGIDLFNTPYGDRNSLGPELATEVDAAMHRLTDAANRAGTVIYTIDARGLQPLVLDAAFHLPAGGGGAGDVMRMERIERNGFYGSQAGLAYIAKLTGGLAYENGNDLNFGLRQVLEDQKGYYLLGFSPEPGLLTEDRAAIRFHKISVHVAQHGSHVRSRTGFFGETDEMASPKPTTPVEQLRAAMLSPFHSAAIRLRLTPIYAEVSKVGPVVRNLIHVDTRDLHFDSKIDGTSSARIGVVIVAVGADERPLAIVERTMDLHIRAGKMDQYLRDGAILSLDVPAQKPGPYQIRVAVRDDATEKVGSAGQYIDIPDVKKAHLALTSVVLADGGSKLVAGRLDSAAVRRQFHGGSEVDYYCILQSSHKLKDADASAMDVTVHLLRDGKEVYSGPATVEKKIEGRQVVAGMVKLNQNLAPGEYFLGLTAMDNPKKPKFAAAQWTDFGVMP
jgi:VWFA-related protein